MSGGFNLTANLNMALAAGSLRNVAQQIQQGLAGISAGVNVTVSPSAATALGALNTQVTGLTTNLAALSTQALTTGASLNSLAASFRNVQGAASSIASAGAAISSSISQSGTAARSTATSFRTMEGSIESAGRRIVAFSVAGAGLYAFVATIKASFTEGVAFERQMVRIAQTGGQLKISVQEVSQEIGRLATTWGVSSKSLGDAAVRLQQAGLAANEMRAALETIAKTDLTASFGGIDKATEGLISLRANFGVTASEYEAKMGAINSVSNQFAVSSSDLVSILQRVGAGFRAAGGSMEELTAIAATLRSTTRESADSIASGLRTILQRVQRSSTIENLKQLGVELRHTKTEAEALGNINLTDQFVGPLEAIKRLSTAMSGIRSTDSRFAAIANELGGYRQIAKVIPLLQEQEKVQKALNVAQAGGVQLTDSASKTQGVLAIEAQKVNETFLQLGRNVLANEGFRAMASTVLTLANYLGKALDFAKPLIPVLTALAAVRIGQMVFPTAVKVASAIAPKFAAGGVVPGSGNTDSVRADLTPGEFVLRKSSAQAIGYDNLHRLNRFAEGGEATPALLALNPLESGRGRQDVRNLRLTPGFQGAARRYVNQRVSYLEQDQPPAFGMGQRATMEGILFEHYMQKHLSGFSGGEGLDFPNLSQGDKEKLGRMTGQDVSGVAGLELKRTGSSRHLTETMKKFRGYASGGEAGKDSIPALLMPGEFVFNKEAVNRIGPTAMRSMNQTGRLPQHFATGGPVGFSTGSDEPVEQYRIQGRQSNLPTAMAKQGFTQSQIDQTLNDLATQEIPKLARVVLLFTKTMEDGVAKLSVTGTSVVNQTRLSPAEQKHLAESHMGLGLKTPHPLADPRYNQPGHGLHESVAGYFSKRRRVGGKGQMDWDEASQHAMVGIVESAATYDPTTNVPFAIHAQRRAIGSVNKNDEFNANRHRSHLERSAAEAAQRATTQTNADGSETTENLLNVESAVIPHNVKAADLVNQKKINAYVRKNMPRSLRAAYKEMKAQKDLSAEERQARPQVSAEDRRAVEEATIRLHQEFESPPSTRSTAAHQPIVPIAVPLSPPAAPRRDTAATIVTKASGASGGGIKPPAKPFVADASNDFGPYPDSLFRRGGDLTHHKVSAGELHSLYEAGNAAPARLTSPEENEYRKQQSYLLSHSRDTSEEQAYRESQKLRYQHEHGNQTTFPKLQGGIADHPLGRPDEPFGPPAPHVAGGLHFRAPPRLQERPTIAPGSYDDRNKSEGKYQAGVLQNNQARVERANEPTFEKAQRARLFATVASMDAKYKSGSSDTDEFRSARAEVRSVTDPLFLRQMAQDKANVGTSEDQRRLGLGTFIYGQEVTGPPTPASHRFVGPPTPPRPLDNGDFTLADVQTLTSLNDKREARGLLHRGVPPSRTNTYAPNELRPISHEAREKQLGRDPNKRRSTIAGIAQERAQTEFGRRGGVNMLSDETQGAILDAETRKVKEELLAVTVRQVQASRDGISREEAFNVARQQVHQAAANGGAVIQDRKTGSTIGLTENVRRLTDGQGNTRTQLDYAKHSAEDLAKERADSEIARKGGPNLLSKGTQDTILAKHTGDVQEELRQAIVREVQARRVGISRTEALNIADEHLAKVEQEVAAGMARPAIVRDARYGHIVGNEDNVDAMLRDGVTPPHAKGWFGRTASKIGGYMPAGLKKFGSSVSGWMTDNPGKVQAAGFLGLYGAGAVADQFDRHAGTAGVAVESGRSDSFVRNKGVGGLIQGGLMGAAIGGTLGSAIPVVGTAIGVAAGAFAGAATGLVTSMTEASKEIADVKIANSLIQFSESLRAATVGGTGTSAATFAAIAQERKDIAEESRAKNAKAATFLGLGLGPVDQNDFDARQKASLREHYAAKLPEMTGQLQSYATDLVKENRGATPADIYKRLLAGGGGENAKQRDQIASVRKVSTDVVDKENLKFIKDAQIAQQAQTAGLAGGAGVDRNIHVFNRLSAAMEIATAGLADLNAKSHALSDAFSGQVSASKFTGLSDMLAQVGNPNHAEYGESVRAVTGPLGAGGEDLANALVANNRLQKVLASVVPRVSNASPLNDKDYDYSGKIQSQAIQGLGYKDFKDLPEQLQRALTAAVGKFAAMGPERIRTGVQEDAGGVIREATEAQSAAAREAIAKAAKGTEASAERFSQGMEQLRQRSVIVGQAKDRIEDSRLASTRQSAVFQSQEFGSRQSPIDFISLQQLQQPFNARQERLTGERGNAALDAEYLGERLRGVQAKIGPAAEREQDMLRAGKGAGPEFQAAVINLVRLKDESGRLQEALKHLSDASERNAGIQEKLASIQSDRQGRLGFQEKYLTSDEQGRNTMNRGLLLANAANNQGSIKGFSVPDQGLILQTLRSLGQAKLTGFNGSPQADMLHRRLIEQSLGAGVVDPDNGREEVGLKRDALENTKVAITANKELASAMATTNDKLIENFRTSTDQFLSRLQATLTRSQITDKEGAKDQAKVRLEGLQGLDKQKAILAAGGITTDRQLQTATEDKRNIKLYQDSIDNSRELTAKKDAAIDIVDKGTGPSLSGIRFGGGGNDISLEKKSWYSTPHPVASGDLLSKLDEYMKEHLANISPLHESVREEFKQRYGVAETRESRGGEKVSIKDILIESIDAATAKEHNKSADDRRKYGAAFSAQGLDATAIDKSARNDPGGLLSAIEQFEKNKVTFSSLEKSVGDTKANFDALNASIDTLKKSLGTSEETAPAGRPKLLASGGDVGTHPGGAQGTDTVPAWLTPGEFIVNRESAQANRALLEGVNASRGTKYMAGGGLVNEDSQSSNEALVATRAAYASLDEAKKKELWKTSTDFVWKTYGSIDGMEKILGASVKERRKKMTPQAEGDARWYAEQYKEREREVASQKDLEIAEAKFEEARKSDPKLDALITNRQDAAEKKASQSRRLEDAKITLAGWERELAKMEKTGVGNFDYSTRVTEIAEAKKQIGEMFEGVTKTAARLSGYDQEFAATQEGRKLLGARKTRDEFEKQAPIRANEQVKRDANFAREVREDAKGLANQKAIVGLREQKWAPVPIDDPRRAAFVRLTPEQKEAQIGNARTVLEIAQQRKYPTDEFNRMNPVLRAKVEEHLATESVEQQKRLNANKKDMLPGQIAALENLRKLEADVLRERSPTDQSQQLLGREHQNILFDDYLRQYKIYFAGLNANQKQMLMVEPDATFDPKDEKVSPRNRAALQARLEAKEQIRKQLTEQAKVADVIDQGPAVLMELHKQAIANPFGGAAQVILAQRVQAAQAARRERLGKEDDKDPRLAAREQAELGQALLSNFQAGQQRGLRGRQRMAHYVDPGSFFNAGRPGMEAQNAIAGAAFGQQAAMEEKDRNPQWQADMALQKARRAAAGGDNMVPGMAAGGLIMAGGGVVDDVPAYLSRGEMVMNRAATRAIGPRALDHANKFAAGGFVPQYMAGGGQAGSVQTSANPDMAAFGQDFSAAVGNFNTASQALAQSFVAWGNQAAALGEALGRFPSTVTHQVSGRTEVIVNGAEALSRMTDGLQALIAEKIDAAIKNMLKDKLPDA